MYQTDWDITEVGLNVVDLEGVAAYYQQVLGLVVLDRTPEMVALGIEATQTVLLRLFKAQYEADHNYGLYHVAYLLPSRESLGDFMRHVIKQQIPIVGVADHGYSEAIYLEDPEGNGIEVYRDLSMLDWDIMPDGKIIGKTDPLDVVSLIESSHFDADQFRLPVGATIGHMHLSVRDSRSAADWYMQVLGVADKFSMSGGSWLSTGLYHHQLAVNQWAGKRLAKRQSGQPGLAYYQIKVKQPEIFEQLYVRASAAKALMGELHSKVFEVVDIDGIVTKIEK